MSRAQFIEVECFGGPMDGTKAYVQFCKTVTFEEFRLDMMRVDKSVYGFEAIDDGRFRLRYLSTHSEPAFLL
jgi:hypothetical protein